MSFHTTWYILNAIEEFKKYWGLDKSFHTTWYILNKFKRVHKEVGDTKASTPHGTF